MVLLTILSLFTIASCTYAQQGLLVPGKIGQAFNFDGNHWLRPASIGMLDKVTVSLWIKPGAATEPIIALLNTNDWQRSVMHFQLYEGHVQFVVADAGEVFTESVPGSASDWQLITCVFDSVAKTSAVYINGNLDRIVDLERTVPADLTNFRIGSWNDGSRVYNGLMDDFRIYDTALTADEVKSIYDGAAPTHNLATHYTFDSLDKSVIADASGNGRDAKVLGVSAYSGLDVAKVAADMGIPALRKGFVSTKPGEDWTKAIVTGNGVMGAMVIGDPVDETIIMDRAGLFLPLHKPLPPVDTASHLSEIRDMIAKGDYQKSADYVVKLSHDEGWGYKRWTDPYVPAFDIKVKMQASGEPREYLRGVDFPTGVASVRYVDDKGRYLRKVFISRPDNVAVLQITGPAEGSVNCSLELAQTPHAWGVKEFKTTADGEWMTYRTSFNEKWPGSLQGCEGVSRVVVTGGERKTKDGRIVITNADQVLVLTRVELSYNYDKPAIDDLKKKLSAIPADYNALLARHEKIHGGILDRVKLDLGGDAADHALSSEQLYAKSAVGKLNAALVEKEFYAARYNILSSSGELPPPLQGIWTGTWNPWWSGDFTQNGNMQSAIAANNSAAMPEAMQAMFKYMDKQMDDYRTNAKRLYGTRGIHVPSRTSSHGLNNHFDEVWPMTFWTAGAGWNAHFYYDYWLYTGDHDFLIRKALPFMMDAVAFYEDFLKPGPDGKFVFNPSYSPENNPGNNSSQACINATMDISVAKELLNNLVTVCTEQKLFPDKVKRWKSMLAKMPDYMINKDGAIKEWTISLLDDNYAHRHCSHLYALFDGMPKEIEDSPKLQAAFKKAADLRMDIRKREGGGTMAFGLVQIGLAMSSLRDPKSSYEVVDWLANKFWQTNMVTTHDPKTIFNTDNSGGFPAIVIKMLMYSQPGMIELLPALPREWPTGRVQGLPCRGAVTVVDLQWKPGGATVVLQAKSAQTVTIKMPYPIKSITGEIKPKPSLRGENCRQIVLPAGKSVRLVING